MSVIVNTGNATGFADGTAFSTTRGDAGLVQVVQLDVVTLPVSGPLTNAELRAAAVPVSGPLTDAQLRAAAVPVSGTFWQATQPVSGTFFQATQPVSNTQLPAALAAGGGLKVEGIAGGVAVPVSGAFFQATQPVSGPLTDAQLRATPVPVSGTFFQATQPVSLATNTPDVTDRAARLLGVVASIAAALPAGTNTIGAVTGPAAAALALDATLTNGNQVAQLRSSTLIVTGTAAAGTGVTVTLPAVAGQFHYITRINIVKYASVATVGAAAPTVVTSTNIPGSVAWTLPTALAVGTQFETDVEPAGPIKSSVANTATTVVAAALASIIYRITVYYYAAA